MNSLLRIWWRQALILLILVLGLGNLACTTLIDAGAMNTFGIASEVADDSTTAERRAELAEGITALVQLQLRITSAGYLLGMATCAASVLLLRWPGGQPSARAKAVA